jgi:hypothetical protein
MRLVQILLPRRIHGKARGIGLACLHAPESVLQHGGLWRAILVRCSSLKMAEVSRLRLQRSIEVALAASRLGAGIVSKGAGRAMGQGQASRTSAGSTGVAFRRVGLPEYNAVQQSGQ